MKTDDNGNHGVARKRGSGRPPEEWNPSEEQRDMLETVLSQAEEANTLLKSGGDFPSRENLKKAKFLFGIIIEKLKFIRVTKNTDVFPLEDFDMFVEGCVEFADGAKEAVGTLYEAYIGYIGADEASVIAGEAYGRIQFTKAMLAAHDDKIRESVQRVNGGNPRRCFIGLRLKKDEDYE